MGCYSSPFIFYMSSSLVKTGSMSMAFFVSQRFEIEYILRDFFNIYMLTVCLHLRKAVQHSVKASLRSFGSALFAVSVVVNSQLKAKENYGKKTKGLNLVRYSRDMDGPASPAVYCVHVCR